MEIFVAYVSDVRPQDDSVIVISNNGVIPEAPARVLKRRANPLYGETGNLPEVGEMGLVLHLEDEQYFWLGSFSNWIENICQSIAGVSFDLHNSGIWKRIADDGTLELFHPSGIYIKIGNDTTKSSIIRHQRTVKKEWLQDTTTYYVPEDTPKTLYIEHKYQVTAPSGTPCPSDTRRKIYTGGVIKTSKVTLDANGKIELEHETTTNAIFKFTISKEGDLTVIVPDGRNVFLGSNNGTQELVTKDFLTTVFDLHTHGGVMSGNSTTLTPTPTAGNNYTTIKTKAV